MKHNTNITQRIGKNIKVHRLLRGMKQRELADIIGVSYQQVQKYENGKSAVSIDKLLVLQAVFGVSLDELTGNSIPPLLDAPSAHGYEVLRLFDEIASATIQRRVVALLQALANPRSTE